MPTFLDEVADTLAKELSTQARDKDVITPLVVAFSGGPDSTALLLALHKISERAGIKLYACHINHNLRGDESRADEEFCQKLCSKLQIPLEQVSLPLESGSAPSEDLMRQFRYQALLDFARRSKASFIATGHTLDDQAETMLFRLFRGTSPAGLKAMESTRMLAEDPAVYVVRPMLSLSKADCLRFLADEGIAARVDSSNKNEQYLRNYIRWQMVPVIESRFPEWKEHLGNLHQMLSDDDDYFEKIIQDLENEVRLESNLWSAEKTLTLPASLLSRLIVFELTRRNIQPSFERVKAIRSFIEGRDKHNAITLSSECVLKRVKENGITKGILWVETSKFAQEESEFYDTFFGNQCSLIRMPKQPGSSTSNVITWLNKALKVDFCSSHKSDYPPPSEWQALVDLSRVAQPLYVRTRKPGDLIQPFGMQETVRLKKYLQTHKSVNLPTLGTRKSMVVVANDEEVIWVPGVGLSEKLRVQKGSQAVHKLVFNELAPGNNTWA
ncbi:MAG: tRNA lysidine(34) synthetase TilS [Candidatus Melainabacteria bacterium]|nr:tRNA lysidine(34) synthetase TilS [Candidatus Melainabacteria bacterium]